MKCLSLQLNLTNAPKSFAAQLVDHLRSIGRFPELDRDPDRPDDLCLNFFTEDAASLWADIQAHVLNDRELGEQTKQIATIICEGDQGWDNQILLWPESDTEK
ncbi:MAG: hypothetical protein K6L76_07325 [Agarilytica sp.]